MRNIFLFSLPLTIVVAAGCGSQPTQQAARSELERDLTLVTRLANPPVASPDRPVASAIELGELRTQAGTSASVQQVVRHRKAVRRPARHLAATAKPVRPATIARPTIADVVVPNPGIQPVAAVPADSRELPPGKTISVIPVSNGPSPSGERGEEDFPRRGTAGIGFGGGGSGMGGSGMGGGCRPGRGTGIPEFGGQPRPRGILY